MGIALPVYIAMGLVVGVDLHLLDEGRVVPAYRHLVAQFTLEGSSQLPFKHPRRDEPQVDLATFIISPNEGA